MRVSACTHGLSGVTAQRGPLDVHVAGRIANLISNPAPDDFPALYIVIKSELPDDRADIMRSISVYETSGNRINADELT